MYEWYQEYYVGAAHGLAGIYYYLMQVSGTGDQVSPAAISCSFELALDEIRLGRIPPLMALLL